MKFFLGPKGASNMCLGLSTLIFVLMLWGCQKQTSLGNADDVAASSATSSDTVADAGVQTDAASSDATDVQANVDDVNPMLSDAAETSEADNGVEDDISATSTGLPTGLPFTFSREDKGVPLSQDEVTGFTTRLSAFLGAVDYFQWVLWTSHGMDASAGLPDYMVWWQDVSAVKEGDLVTFRHSSTAGAHNIMIPTPKVLSQAAGGYLLSGDAIMGRVVEQFSKGITATCKGMVWDEDDPNPYLMARNIATSNHSFEMEGGRKKAVDYSPWFNTYEEWNAQRIFFPHNPYWGEVYVTNMRSKDDVPHLYNAAPWLKYVAEYGADESVRDAAAEAFETLVGFAKDIVDSGYHIRTKDAAGDAYIPTEDLASFVLYDPLIPNAECNAKLSSALLAYGAPLGNACGKGEGGDYERVATAGHYYNLAIIRNFHVSALLNSLLVGEDAIALELMEGMALRVDGYMVPLPDTPGSDHPAWAGELASYLIQAATAGLPLTSDEARHIHTQYHAALDVYETWERWDLWSDSVPDGSYNHTTGYRPSHGDTYVFIETIAAALSYCYSPFKNSAGVQWVDCSLLAAPSQWAANAE